MFNNFKSYLSLFQLLILFVSKFPITQQQTNIDNYNCITCQSNSNLYYCGHNNGLSGLCCAYSYNSYRGRCQQTNLQNYTCSNNILAVNQKYSVCPYDKNQCGSIISSYNSTRNNTLLSSNEIQTQMTTASLKQNTICVWNLKLNQIINNDKTKFNTLILRIDMISDVNVTINHAYNITQPLYSYQQSYSLQNTFEFKDFINTDELYIIAQATSSSYPILKFSYFHYEQEDFTQKIIIIFSIVTGCSFVFGLLTYLSMVCVAARAQYVQQNKNNSEKQKNNVKFHQIKQTQQEDQSQELRNKQSIKHEKNKKSFQQEKSKKRNSFNDISSIFDHENNNASLNQSRSQNNSPKLSRISQNRLSQNYNRSVLPQKTTKVNRGQSIQKSNRQMQQNDIV